MGDINQKTTKLPQVYATSLITGLEGSGEKTDPVIIGSAGGYKMFADWVNDSPVSG